MSLRNLFCVVSAIAFAVFAVPGTAAPTKQYSIQVLSFPEDGVGTPGVTAVPVKVAVNIKNMSPPSTANSNISSFKFKLAGVTVATDSAHAPTCPDALCSVTTDGVEVTNISPPIQAPSPAKPYYTVTFYVASCGDITVIDPTSGTQGAAVYGGSQFTGSKFDFKFDSSLPTSTASAITCGELFCSSTAFTVPGSNPVVTGFRGLYDKDGVCGASDATPYYVTNELNSAAKILHFRWPNQAPADPGFFAAFKYTIAGITAASNPQVSWLPATGTPEFITAPACLSKNLPAPYASLNADLSSNANDNKFKVTLSQGVTYAPLVASLPFPIVLGTERLQVTAINTSSGQWTVVRGTGGTNRSQHLTGDLVMSTPLPILSSVNAPYTNGNHAQMCTFEDGPVLWFIDIGDGYVKPGF